MAAKCSRIFSTEFANPRRLSAGIQASAQAAVAQAGIYKIFISSAVRPSRTLMQFSRILYGEDTHEVIFPSAERKEAPLRRSAPFIASAVNNNNQGIAIDDGRSSCRDRRFILPPLRRLYQGLRQPLVGETAMLLDYILGGGVTIFLTVYLVYALIRPERF
ncbi:K(+)-transporting ATPase subunit F [Rhizobium rhizogenes]|jgi:K+-transporting ATPase KdpF subunit